MAAKRNFDLKAIGKRIRASREKLGLSREEFAEIVDLSDYYIGQIERGERQMSLSVLVKISRHLHETLDYLIFGIKDPSANYLREDCSDTYELSDNKNKIWEINNL